MVVVNNAFSAMRAMDIHIHPLANLWCALVQSSPLKDMFPKLCKLVEIAMIYVRGYIMKKITSFKFLMLCVFMFVNACWLLTNFVSLHPILLVLGSIEDKRTFSNVSFLKNKLHNRLTVHWPLAKTMFAQKHYKLTSFLYKEFVSNWRA